MATTTRTKAVPASGEVADSRLRWLGRGLAALAVGLAFNSVLGPFVADRLDYPVSETMRNQTIGLDAAGLVLVAPITLLIAILALRGHRAAPVLALGPTSYVAYMFVQYIAGPDHLDYPRVMILQLGLFIGGWLLAALAWSIARSRQPGSPLLSPRHGYVSLALGFFVLLRYLPGLWGSLGAEALPDQAAQDPAMYWLIVLLDLGVYLPIAVLAAIGLRRGRAWATTLHRGAVGWFLLVSVAVTAMSAAMLANDDPSASTGQLVLFVVTVVAVAGYAYAIDRGLFEPIEPGPAAGPSGLAEIEPERRHVV